MYTRHKPQLVEVLDQLIKRKLKEPQFPYVGDYRLTDRYVYNHIMYPLTDPLKIVATWHEFNIVFS